jgi:hypothetical protein
MNYVFPSDYGERGCYVVAIDAALVPLVAGALRIFEQPWAWRTVEDYERGYNAFAELQACMAVTCLNKLIESNNQIYRLLDTNLTGKEYTEGLDPITGEPIAEPPIPVVPELPIYPLLVRVARVEQLLDNAFNGLISDDWPNPVSIRDQLQAIQDALAADDADIEQILNDLTAVLALLA